MLLQEANGTPPYNRVFIIFNKRFIIKNTIKKQLKCISLHCATYSPRNTIWRSRKWSWRQWDRNIFRHRSFHGRNKLHILYPMCVYISQYFLVHDVYSVRAAFSQFLITLIHLISTTEDRHTFAYSALQLRNSIVNKSQGHSIGIKRGDSQTLMESPFPVHTITLIISIFQFLLH